MNDICLQIKSRYMRKNKHLQDLFTRKVEVFQRQNFDRETVLPNQNRKQNHFAFTNLQRAPVNAKLHIELIPRYIFTHIETRTIKSYAFELINYKNNFRSRVVRNNLTQLFLQRNILEYYALHQTDHQYRCGHYTFNMNRWYSSLLL